MCSQASWKHVRCWSSLRKFICWVWLHNFWLRVEEVFRWFSCTICKGFRLQMTSLNQKTLTNANWKSSFLLVVISHENFLDHPSRSHPQFLFIFQVRQRKMKLEQMDFREPFRFDSSFHSGWRKMHRSTSNSITASQGESRRTQSRCRFFFRFKAFNYERNKGTFHVRFTLIEIL